MFDEFHDQRAGAFGAQGENGPAHSQRIGDDALMSDVHLPLGKVFFDALLESGPVETRNEMRQTPVQVLFNLIWN